jgi:hypothetical protein
MGRYQENRVLDSEAFGAALFVTELLDRIGVPYVVGGSIASTVHGIIPSTLDVDFVADLQLEHVLSLVAGLGDATSMPTSPQFAGLLVIGAHLI